MDWNNTTTAPTTYITPISPYTKKHAIPEYAYHINASVTLVLCIFAITGNLVVILVFACNKNLRNLNNQAVILLAITDFLRGTIVMIPKVVTHYTMMDDLVEPICSITALFSAFTFFFNPMVLALIACIRYFVIVPWTRRSLFLSQGKLQVAVGFIFSISVVFSILPFVGVGVYKFSIYHGVCFADWNEENRVFRTIFYIFVIGIAFPILIFSYSKLFLVLKSHNRSLKSNLPSIYFRNSNAQGERNIPCNDIPRTRSISAMRYVDFIKAQTATKIRRDDDDGEETIRTDMPAAASSLDVKSFEFKQKASFKTRAKSDGRVHSSSIISLDVSLCTIDKKTKTETTRKTASIIAVTETKDPVQGTSSSVNVTVKERKKTRVRPMLGRSLSKQEYQMTKLMLLIFIAYIVCWFPAAVVNILALINTNNVPAIWYFIIVTMVELKSCLNPLIYGLGNRQYRKVIVKFFKRYF